MSIKVRIKRKRRWGSEQISAKKRQETRYQNQLRNIGLFQNYLYEETILRHTVLITVDKTVINE